MADITIFYIWIPVRVFKTPNTFRSHTIRTITTTTFRIVLMVLSIGINELISHRATPTIMITSKIVNSGIDLILKGKSKCNLLHSRNCYIISE
jgi:hypothetical protein